MQHLRIIPTLTHGLLDNLTGIVLLVSPWIFDFQTVRGAATYIPMMLGGFLLLSNLFTRHELGLVKVLPFRYHLLLDVVLGCFLMLSPWVFAFHERILMPHVVCGMFIALVPLFSVRKPFDESQFTEVVIREGQAEVVRYARSSDSSSY
jgi:hypothetical protein